MEEKIDKVSEMIAASKRLVVFTGAGIIVFILIVTVTGVAGFYAFTMDLPGIDALKDYRPSISSRVYDDKNELIDEFFLEDRKLIKINEVPRVAIQAFVAAEDSRFFEHKGFDVQSIFRALITRGGTHHPGRQHHHAAGGQDDVSFSRKNIPVNSKRPFLLIRSTGI